MTVSKLNKAFLQNQAAAINPQITLPQPAIFELPEKVLQFGTGVLLRGLPDYFIDQANQKGIFNGRVVMVKSTDAGSTDAFVEQDNLYTLLVRGMDQGKPVEEFSVNAAVSRALSARTQWGEILKCARNPEMQIIISNTTEVGIQLTDDKVKQSPPDSFPGKLTAFLYERFRAFGGSSESGMVIVPCELLPNNGKILQEIVVKLAEQNRMETEFIEWLGQHNTFCNSLVDRIVPGKPDAESLQKIQNQLGYTDALLTVSEVYRLWAIEGDERIKNVLSFDQADAGVIIELDIAPYRERKLRLLNGTHTISVALGFLSGLDTVGDCMHDPEMSRFIREVMHQEIVPTVPVDEVSARQFADEVLDRFQNPYLVHPLIHITLQYTSKMRMRNVPTLLRYYEKFNAAPPLFTSGFAAYLLFMRSAMQENGKFFGERNGQLYPIQDDFAEYFYQQWQKVNNGNQASMRSFVQAVLANELLWGTDLSQLPEFAEAVGENLLQLIQRVK